MVLSSLISGAASAYGSYLSYKTAKENRKWMEKMSNTAHQREVKDLRKAGLNPILTATGGSGATTPTANTTADFSGLSEAGSSAVEAYQNAKRLKNETKKNESDIELNKQLGNKADYEADQAHYNSALAREQTQLLQEYGPLERQAQIRNIDVNTAKTLQDIQNSKDITQAQIKNLDSSTAKQLKETNAITKRSGWSINVPKLGELGFYTQQ